MLVIENHKIFSISKDTIKNFSIFIGKVKIISYPVQVSVIQISVIMLNSSHTHSRFQLLGNLTNSNTYFLHLYHKYFTKMYTKCELIATQRIILSILILCTKP